MTRAFSNTIASYEIMPFQMNSIKLNLCNQSHFQEKKCLQTNGFCSFFWWKKIIAFIYELNILNGMPRSDVKMNELGQIFTFYLVRAVQLSFWRQPFYWHEFCLFVNFIILWLQMMNPFYSPAFVPTWFNHCYASIGLFLCSSMFKEN